MPHRSKELCKLLNHSRQCTINTHWGLVSVLYQFCTRNFPSTSKIYSFISIIYISYLFVFIFNYSSLQVIENFVFSFVSYDTVIDKIIDRRFNSYIFCNNFNCIWLLPPPLVKNINSFVAKDIVSVLTKSQNLLTLFNGTYFSRSSFLKVI